MKSILSILLSFICFQLIGQNLVSFSLRESRTKEQLNQSIGPNLPPAKYGLDIYKVLYTMNDVNGKLDTASGALYIPIDDGDRVYSLICDMHGTTDRTWYPSDYFSSTTALLTVDGDFISYAPDYLGLGSSRGFHPYMHAESEAMAGIEMHRAVLEVLEMLNITHDNRLFITGYSQGGHAAMAMHRLIQQNFGAEFNVIASSPMSGPYSVKEIMLNKMLEDFPYLPGIAFMPYVILSYKEVYGDVYNDLSEIFKTSYISPIQRFRNGEITLQSMATQLAGLLAFFTNSLKPRNMLREDVLQTLLNNPESHPIYLAIADNDLLNWVPDSPVRLFYCTADEQVPYTNSIKALEYFVEGGAKDVIAESKGNLSHGDCVAPATLATRIFFKSFVTTNTIQVPSDKIRLYPNPVTDGKLYLNNEGVSLLDEGTVFAHIISLEGRRLKGIFSVNDGSIDVSDLPAGVYFLQIFDKDKNPHNLKFVIN